MKNNAVKAVVIRSCVLLPSSYSYVSCALLTSEKLFFKKLFGCLIPKGSENARDQQEDEGKEPDRTE